MAIHFPLDSLAASIIEMLPDPLVIIDSTGAIILVNSQFTQVFGYSEAEILGKEIETLIPERFHASHHHFRDLFLHAPKTREMGQGSDLKLMGRHQNQTEFPVEVSLSPLVRNDQTIVLSTIRDISDRIRIQDHLRYLSTHDVLTGLYNRTYYEEEQSRIQKGRHFPISLIVIDVDGLKAVNDTSGHAVGDELLRRVGAILHEAFRSDDIIARLGGDEFSILLPDTDEKTLQGMIERLEKVRQAYNQKHGFPEVFFSSGTAIAEKGDVLAQLFRQADARMYAQKRGKKNQATPKNLGS